MSFTSWHDCQNILNFFFTILYSNFFQCTCKYRWNISACSFLMCMTGGVGGSLNKTSIKSNTKVLLWKLAKTWMSLSKSLFSVNFMWGFFLTGKPVYSVSEGSFLGYWVQLLCIIWAHVWAGDFAIATTFTGRRVLPRLQLVQVRVNDETRLSTFCCLVLVLLRFHLFLNF